VLRVSGARLLQSRLASSLCLLRGRLHVWHRGSLRPEPAYDYYRTQPWLRGSLRQLLPRSGLSGKKDRRDDAELARRWTTGEVAAALDLKPAERDALISLVNRAAEGDMGPHGDDVGGGSEGVDTAASEAAALLAAAAKAVGSTANPVTGSQRRALAGCFKQLLPLVVNQGPASVSSVEGWL